MKTINIVFGKTKDELPKRDDDLWDFDCQELFDGSVEPREDVDYWFIDGRLYEVKKELVKELEKAYDILDQVQESDILQSENGEDKNSAMWNVGEAMGCIDNAIDVVEEFNKHNIK